MLIPWLKVTSRIAAAKNSQVARMRATKTAFNVFLFKLKQCVIPPLTVPALQS